MGSIYLIRHGQASLGAANYDELSPLGVRQSQLCGEFLHRWTNGRFLATPHRGLTPKRDRYSIAFFFNPTWDTVADALPTCIGPDNPPRFKPVKFLDYREW